jgi:hypothetical protein
MLDDERIRILIWIRNSDKRIRIQEAQNLTDPDPQEFPLPPPTDGIHSRAVYFPRFGPGNAKRERKNIVHFTTPY